jgi:EAL domain-containing protein (putative c-di-GMP-specific phosphodiesterase class I)
MTVTAEGIEDEQVCDYLREIGCLQGQGYLFGKAQPGGTITPAGDDRAVA